MPEEENVPTQPQTSSPQINIEPVVTPAPRERTTIDTRPGYDTLGSPLQPETKQGK